MVKLRPGDPAPGFSLDSVNMGRVTLGEYRGRRVLLVFGRYFGCPVCQYDFDQLIRFRRERGIDVIYVVQSRPESAAEYISGLGVDFPVVAVPMEAGGYRVYDAYGVGALGPVSIIQIFRRARDARKAGKVHGPYEGRETQSPADFVVNVDGVILRAHVGLFDPGELTAFLRGLG
ncbi:MAG TPA: peroxiredoxin-like family protein [Candidatus Bathyarchaeia archaeon]